MRVKNNEWRDLMRLRFINKAPILGFLALLLTAKFSFANGCLSSAFSGSLPKEASWRESFSYSDAIATSQAREQEMIKYHKSMVDLITGVGQHADTPPIEFFAAEGVRMKYEYHTTGDSGIPTRILLSGVGKEGKLKGTILLPVSGHTGVANAKQWSKTDTYSLYTDKSKDSAGKSWDSGYSESTLQPLVKDVKSLDLVTSHDIEISLSPSQATRILYYRSGSGGPGGYFDGRVVELLWDGT